LGPARELGQRAVAIGLETLAVAKIHERALAMLESSGSRNGLIERANIFFIEAISPIEETHRVALHAKVRLRRLSRRLSRTTLGLAASNRALKRGTARHKNVEVARRKGDEHYKALLAESGRLRQRLRYLTHQFLAAQEDHRKKMSHDLQDDIAQTLLGINVRLLTLKRATAGTASGFKRDCQY